MKKLILAPAVAIALTGLALPGSPVFAAPAAECQNMTLNVADECFISLNKDTMPADGVAVTIAGLPEGAELSSVSVVRPGTPASEMTTVVLSSEAAPTFKVYGPNASTAGDLSGDYAVTATLADGSTVKAGVIRYLDEDTSVTGDPEVYVQNGQIDYQQFQQLGVTVWYKNLLAKTEYTWKLEGDNVTAEGTFTSEKYPEAGGYFYLKVPELANKEASELAGTYTVTLTDPNGQEVPSQATFEVVAPGDVDVQDPTAEPTTEPTTEPTASPTTQAPTQTATPEPTPTASEKTWTWNGEPLKDGLNISPTFITPDNFTGEEDGKGVAFAVKGCTPGQTVTATCGDQTWTGTFTVGYRDDAQGGDSDSKTDSSDSKNQNNSGTQNGSKNELPRTGTELGGLAAGAGLLLVGGATVLLTRRKRKS